MMQFKEGGEKAINLMMVVMVVVVVVMAGLVVVGLVMVDMEVAIMKIAIMMVVNSCYLPFRLPRANSLALPLPAS